MTKEQRSRLEMMADPSSETWDLSDNDIAAIKAALAALAAREAEVAGLVAVLTRIRPWLVCDATCLNCEEDEPCATLDSLRLIDDTLNDRQPPQPAPDTEACRKRGHGPVVCLDCGAPSVPVESVRDYPPLDEP